MAGFFIYSSREGTADVRKLALNRGYRLCPLNDDPATFWGYIAEAAAGGDPVIIVSHGNANGPLMVDGEYGADMTHAEILALGTVLAAGCCELFVLSCHTGGGAFWNALITTQVSAVAPGGACSFGNVFDQAFVVKSVDPGEVYVTAIPPQSMGRGSRGGLIKLP